MNLSNIFSTDGLPVGRTLFLAWVTATFLHIQWEVDFQFRELDYIEFILEAGALFGYFSALKYLGLFSILTATKVAERNMIKRDPYRYRSILRSDFLFSIASFLVPRSVLIVEIIAMLLAFFLYSETLVRVLAPIGLIMVLIDLPVKSRNAD